MQVYILDSRLPADEVGLSNRVEAKHGFCQWLTNSWDGSLPDLQVEKYGEQS